VSVRTSGGDGGALYWAQRYKGERDEWKQTAEEIFRMACEIEQERDDSDCCVGLMVGLLLDAEREIEEQAAELVALRNEVDEERGQWMPWATGAFQQTFAREAAEEAAADYHAAWQDAEERRALSDTACRNLYGIAKERDDANRALEAERAAHQVTARRLEELRETLADSTRMCEHAQNRWADALGKCYEARRFARSYRRAYLASGCIDAAPVAADHWLNETD
jgi:hypothetical protein